MQKELTFTVTNLCCKTFSSIRIDPAFLVSVTFLTRKIKEQSATNALVHQPNNFAHLLAENRRITEVLFQYAVVFGCRVSCYYMIYNAYLIILHGAHFEHFRLMSCGIFGLQKSSYRTSNFLKPHKRI